MKSVLPARNIGVQGVMSARAGTTRTRMSLNEMFQRMSKELMEKEKNILQMKSSPETLVSSGRFVVVSSICNSVRTYVHSIRTTYTSYVRTYTVQSLTSFKSEVVYK
jgi:hypothetical protein